MQISHYRLGLLVLHAGCLGWLAIAAPAQALTKYAVTPAGHEFHPGNSNNTYPFQQVSARYQQIHDATDMMALNGGGVLVMTHMGFRPAATFNIPAKQWDVQITLSPTAIPASQASTSFSANVTSTPTVVLPYTTLKAPGGIGAGGSPNPILWSFPFRIPYIYAPGPNRNLLWEWQHKNGGAAATTPMDACSGTVRPAPKAGPNAGQGCTATGKTSPAQAQATVSGSTASLSLVNAAASANALLWVGVRRTTLSGPWCSSLYLNPLVAVAGTTNSAGTWNAASTSSLSTTVYWEAFAQFAFADSGLPGGFGLSDMAAFAGPANRGHYVMRLYALGATNGTENATTGSRGLSYGVITMFTIR